MNCKDARKEFLTLLGGALALTERAPLEIHLDECPRCCWELERLQRKSALPRAIWRAGLALGTLDMLEAVAPSRTISRLLPRALSRGPPGCPRCGHRHPDGGAGDVRRPAKERARDGAESGLTRGVAGASGATSADDARGAACFERGAIDFAATRDLGAGKRPDGDSERPRASGGDPRPACRGDRSRPAQRRSGHAEDPGGPECHMGNGPYEGRADRAGDDSGEAGPRLTCRPYPLWPLRHGTRSAVGLLSWRRFTISLPQEEHAVSIHSPTGCCSGPPGSSAAQDPGGKRGAWPQREPGDGEDAGAG